MSAASDTRHYDICVLGGSSGGLAVAIGAALLGAPVALIEPGRPGADAAAELATATLLAVTRQLAAARRLPGLATMPGPDPAGLAAHIAATVEAAGAAHRPERLRALGIDLIEEHGRFDGPDRVIVGSKTVTARRFVLAPPARPLVPAIAGLDRGAFLTPDDPAALAPLPTSLAVLGAGPEALELAQAYRRLGAAVTLVDAGDFLADRDPELVDLLLVRLAAEGIRLRPRTPVRAIASIEGGVALDIDEPEPLQASHLLVAAGRAADLTAFGLDAAGIRVGVDGIVTDRALKTGNPRVFALGGDVSAASTQAGVVLRQVLFRQRRGYDPAAVPRVVRTDPALAEVGLDETAARAAGSTPTILRAPLHENDRARAETAAHGLVKLVTDRQGRLSGAGILAPDAAEAILPWQLALAQGLKVEAVAGLPVAFPSFADASKRAAGAFMAPKLLGAGTRRLVRWLARLG